MADVITLPGLEGCITDNWRKVLSKSLEDENIPREKIEQVIGFIPRCEDRPAAKEPSAGPARKMAARWPGAVYIDEKGEQEEFDSPSQLYTSLTGDKVSGQICDITTVGGKHIESCRAMSLVDNFTIHGYVVRGDGDPPPPSTGSKTAVHEAHEAWKQKLLDENKKFIVMHPMTPTLQEAQKKAEKGPKKKKGEQPFVSPSIAKYPK